MAAHFQFSINSFELMNYVAAYFSLGFFLFLVGVFVLSRNLKNPLNQIFAFYSFSIAWWSLFTIPMITTKNAGAGYFWDQMCLTGAVFIPTTFLHFVLVFLRRAKKQYFFIVGCYAVSLFFLLLNWGHAFVKEVRPTAIFNYYTVPSIAYTVFVSYFSVLSTLSVYFLYKAMRQDSDNPKFLKQAKLLFFASCFGYIGGGTNFLSVYGINVPYFTPVANYAILVYGFAVAYIILRYRFLDIEVIIKKTLVFAGIFTMFMATVGAVTAISQSAIGQHFKMGMMINSLMSVLIAVLLYDPVRKFLVNLTDAYLFQKKEDFKVALNRLAKNIITILDLQEVGETVLNTLQESLRLETGTLILRDEKNKHYGLLTAFNLNLVGRKFPSDSEFIRYFSGSDKSINLEEPDTAHALPNEVVKNLEALKAVICVPLFAHGELIGLLTMGKKRSDQEFTQEEIDYLPVVASQTAIAFKKAQLVEDVIQEREAKIEAEKKAERINYTRALKHEAGNKLVGIEDAAVNMKSHLTEKIAKLRQKLLERFAPKELRDLDQIAELVIKYADNFKMAGRRICMIIDSVVGALGGSKEAKQEMAFRIPWETAKLSANVENIFRFIVDIPDDFKIYGNVDLIERIFENFFTNSRDAMSDLKDKIVYLNGSYRTYEGKPVVWIECWDDGAGVPEELFEKVFEQGFSTKTKPKTEISMQSGHGYGLYVCKKTVEEFHSGRIWLEKREPSGSKFIFWLPCEPMCKEE